MFQEALENPDLAGTDTIKLALTEKLAGLPLALIQAASFINMTQRSVQTYLQLLDQSEDDIIKLLSEDFGDPLRYSNAKNPIATTWLISFDHIRKHHDLAAQILSSMACMHEKNIPLLLLREANSEIDMVNAIAVLTGYSFVTRHTSSDAVGSSNELYDLHRLVQLAARNWLKMQGSLSDWTKACLTRMAQLFPSRDHRNRGVWTVYLPHARRICDDEAVKDCSERFELLEKMGLCFVADGKYADAVDAHTMVVQWREQNGKDSAWLTFESYDNLGQALNLKGHHLAAEFYLQKAFGGLRSALGAEHPSTLTSMANLASTYGNQGRWEKAEELDLQIMEVTKRVHGAEHPLMLTSVCNLATTLNSLHRWAEAEELELQLLETMKRVLGAEHPDTLTTMANLASTFYGQGRWAEAEELDIQVIKTMKRVLGLEHPRTLFGIANLASTYRKQGRWAQAEELSIQVITAMKRVLGAEHIHTLNSMTNLAAIYYKQDRLKRAKELDAQVLETRKGVLGHKHPDTLDSMDRLATTLKAQNREKEAMKLMASCLALRVEVLGPSHPDTLNTSDALARWRGLPGGKAQDERSNLEDNMPIPRSLGRVDGGAEVEKRENKL